MSDIVIKVENLSKQYRLGTINHGMLHKDLQSWWARVRGREDPNAIVSSEHTKILNEHFWALKDISFDVKSGEVLGIIGSNGAGKSTLLKILSRVTAPTSGTIKIKGRVTSLLEVGTGFHPELTGRENVFLNGAILGMTKSEIKSKFDEIVDFAGIEQFIDTPVKRYSSGMYVRLAFAVAAHLEPEILIVDEVLAVGDAQFQKKCLGKMHDVSKEGRTILFVSHNMSAVESLCTKAISLQDGQLINTGTPPEIINAYLSKLYTLSDMPLEQRVDRIGNGKIKTTEFRALDSNGNEVTSLKSGQDYKFEINYLNSTNVPMKDVVVSLDMFDEKNNRVLLFRTNFSNNNLSLRPKNGSISCLVNNLPLTKGEYHFSIFLSYSDNDILDYIENAASMTVDGGDFFGTGIEGMPVHCKILHKSQWTTT